MTSATLLSVRIARKTLEATGVYSYELHSTTGAALPAFTAGSHIDVLLPNASNAATNGVVLTRQYSLCNPPSETHRYCIAVLLDAASRGGSVAMHALQVGDVLQISPPKNHFALAADAPQHLLLAGGIGITPILCMAEQLAQDMAAQCSTQPTEPAAAVASAAFSLHYACRSRERMAFYQRIASAPYASRVQFHFDDGPTTQQLSIAALLQQAAPGTHLYVCGPKGFMDAVLGAARAQHWPEAQLHYEFFGAAVAATASDGAFEVQLARSGRVVQVPADQTVLQALAEAGVSVDNACQQGVCGTCLTRVLGGTPDHKDLYLTPEEQEANDQFLPCCSRSKTPLLVLDL